MKPSTRDGRTTALLLALSVSVLAACENQKTSEYSVAGQQVRVEVSPPTLSLYSRQAYAFAAAVTGTTVQGVNWSVAEGTTGGTIGQDGAYTAPAGTGTFHVVAASQFAPSVLGTATVTVRAVPPGGIPMTTANRTAGVAPLAVFFDAVDDVNSGPSLEGRTFAWTSGVSQPADMEGALYSWDFGDPGSGTWSTTGLSKNLATGYTAAHVYETPGTYTALLTVKLADGTSTSYSQTITVSAFTGTTYYVAANGSDSANGISQATPFLTLGKAMSTALAASGPVRVLMRRGDTFTASTSWAIRKAGPGIIGAYGDGTAGHTTSDPRPVVNCAELGDANIFSAAGTGTDWRVMDLEMVGPSTGTATGPFGPDVSNQGVNGLALRLKLRNWGVGIGWGDYTPIFSTPHDGMAVVDTEVSGVGTYNSYLGGRRLILLGNNFHDSGNTHVLRVWQAHKAVISNNILYRPMAQRHCLKLHGPSVNGPDSVSGARQNCPATRWVTISENLVASSTISQWSISIGPQDSINDERTSHIVYERNRHWQSTSSLISEVEGSASHMMIRNNVFDGSAADTYYSVLYCQRGIEPIPDDVRIYNNTFYKGGANSDTVFFNLTSGCTAGGAGVATNVRIRNNVLAYGSGSPVLVSGGGAGLAQDHNLMTATPGFTNAAAGDFSLTSGSAAVDAGAALTEVREDYLRAARPAGNGLDIGAYESH
jgi:hypothetical protein